MEVFIQWLNHPPRDDHGLCGRLLLLTWSLTFVFMENPDGEIFVLEFNMDGVTGQCLQCLLMIGYDICRKKPSPTKFER